ncbi:MAG: LysR family transcriptional regulator [Opitutaceae bacterium]|nr:LysR family transcriptional regulator [Opitutaceae bacterium]
MNLELRWLRSFVAVADELHLSRAAQQLKLAQPALTAQLQQLEEAVGARLVERTNKVHGLTAAGAALLPEARRLVSGAEGLALLAARAHRGETGRLRAGIIPPAATTPVAEVFRRFSAARPAVEVSLRQASQADLVAALGEGELDLVVGRPVETPGRSGVQGRRLFEEHQGIALRRDDPRAEAAFLALAALTGSRLLLIRGNPHFGQLLLRLAAQHAVPLQSYAADDDFSGLLWMVQAGLGVAPCSLRLADALPAGLVVRPLRPAPPRLRVQALWRGRQPSPTVAHWLELAAPVFA